MTRAGQGPPYWVPRGELSKVYGSNTEIALRAAAGRCYSVSQRCFPGACKIELIELVPTFLVGTRGRPEKVKVVLHIDVGILRPTSVLPVRGAPWNRDMGGPVSRSTPRLRLPASRHPTSGDESSLTRCPTGT
jgi:hypothetical protein